MQKFVNDWKYTQRQICSKKSSCHEKNASLPKRSEMFATDITDFLVFTSLVALGLMIPNFTCNGTYNSTMDA